MRTTFAVGRMTPKTTEIVLVHRDRDEPDPDAGPVPGPWSLRAVVRERRPRAPRAPARTVH